MWGSFPAPHQLLRSLSFSSHFYHLFQALSPSTIPSFLGVPPSLPSFTYRVKLIVLRFLAGTHLRAILYVRTKDCKVVYAPVNINLIRSTVLTDHEGYDKDYMYTLSCCTIKIPGKLLIMSNLKGKGCIYEYPNTSFLGGGSREICSK